MDKFFKITERGSTFSREILAGIVTFMTMAYILCLQPQIMSGAFFGEETGLSASALITTTCLVAAFGSLLMGLWANYPFGLAPGMGENFFVVLSVMPVCVVAVGKENGWQLALGVVFVAGVIFAVLSFLNVRKYLINVISPSLRSGMTSGIGLFIALIGLQGCGIVVSKNEHYVFGSFTQSFAPVIFLIGLIVTTVLHTLKFRGAMLLGIIVSTFAAFCFGLIQPTMPFGLPADPMPVVFKMDVIGVFKHSHVLMPFVFVLVYMLLFDTLATVVGIGTRAGLIKDNHFPNIEKVFAADATATLVGAMAGHSTVAVYVESAAGVESGGRTGLTAVITACCFLAAMFLSPFIMLIGGCPPITSAALVAVGALMLQGMTKIDWDDPSELIPAFMIMVGIPFSYNIADGLVIGLISYPIIKLLCGKAKQVSWILYVLSAILVLYVVFIRI
jgi:AGZA family xanthine/uracil permease-like MFS transporter